MPVEAVTFDFHDTLAECDQWFQLEIRHLVPAFLDWYARNGAISPVSDATRQEAIFAYRTIREQVMEDGVEQDAATCLCLVLDQLGYGVAPETVDRGLESVMRGALPDASPKPGALDTVREIAAAGTPMAVISSAVYHPFLEWTLDAFGILDCFSLIVTSASSGHYKSSTRIYSYTTNSIGANPEHCVHVGDSLRFDIATARRAGMRTVWVHWENEANDGHMADLVVPSLHGLAPRLLSEL